MTNWFDQDGGVYARFRPDYPEGVAAFLAEVAPDTRVAVDVGCGNGQLTVQLASRFVSVIGADPSADQLAHAVRHERVRYAVGAAESIDVEASSASVVTAAQAAHWFDRPRFYDEVRRVLVARGVVALITYGVPELEDALSPRFSEFYRDEVGRYWPPERKLVDSGYAEIAFSMHLDRAHEWRGGYATIVADRHGSSPPRAAPAWVRILLYADP